MKRTELTIEQMEQVNGAGFGDAILEFLEMVFTGMSDDTKNEVPHK